MAISLVAIMRYGKMYGKAHFLPDTSRAAAQRLAMTYLQLETMTDMLDILFHPQSVAVIGASRRPREVGFEVLSNLARGDGRGIGPTKPPTTEVDP